jgi:CMP-N-acetylneuraminic acid synthetase
MIGEKNILAVVPARGGSRSIPQKNLFPLMGIPLICHTLKAAKESRYLEEVILSSDDDNIIAVASKWGINVPFKRPAELAQDDTPMAPVLHHALVAMEEFSRKRFDIVVLLQPTSPLRTSKHIDDAIELYEQKRADSVVSVVQVPHNLTPTSLVQIGKEGKLLPYERTGQKMILQRDKKPSFYARNGPAVLVLARHIILENKPFYTDNTFPYIMPREDSIDIDEPIDLELAEFFLKKREQRKK